LTKRKKLAGYGAIKGKVIETLEGSNQKNSSNHKKTKRKGCIRAGRIGAKPKKVHMKYGGKEDGTDPKALGIACSGNSVGEEGKRKS